MVDGFRQARALAAVVLDGGGHGSGQIRHSHEVKVYLALNGV